MNFLHRANHRRVEVGRNLWQLSGLGPDAQDNVQVILGITKNGDSTTSLCNLCQDSVTLTVKRCPDVWRDPLPLWFVPVASGPGMGYSLSPSPLHFLLGIYVHC